MQKVQHSFFLLTAICLLIVCVVFGVGGCQRSPSLSEAAQIRTSQTIEVSAADITTDIQNRLNITDMVSVSRENLASYFNIYVDDIEDYSFLVSSSESKADELAVFKSSNSDSVAEIKTAVSNHILSKEDSFKNLDPVEYQKVKDAVLVDYDQYVFLAVCNDPESASKAFEAYLK